MAEEAALGIADIVYAEMVECAPTPDETVPVSNPAAPSAPPERDSPTQASHAATIEAVGADPPPAAGWTLLLCLLLTLWSAPLAAQPLAPSDPLTLPLTVALPDPETRPLPLFSDPWYTHAAVGGYMIAGFYDATFTAYALGTGTAREANPLLLPIMRQTSVPVALTIKGAVHVGMSAWLLHEHKQNPTRTFWIAVGLLTAQMVVNVHNYRTGAER